MRIVRFDAGDGRAIQGIVEGGFVRAAAGELEALHPTGVGTALDSVRLLSPIERPGKIVCVGLNYRDHADEGGVDVPDRPLLFAKLPSTHAGPDQTLVIPAVSEQLDYEAELGVVIGRQASRVSVQDALAHVRGYLCVNDISARDLQFADGQWTRGKSLDSTCPVGPWLVTPDEIGEPQSLGVRCRVNGQTLQDGTTADMIFPVDELISYISQAITLEPGDLIATGTPAGVGFVRNPPVFLRDGDQVEVEIESLGVLRNTIRYESRGESHGRR